MKNNRFGLLLIIMLLLLTPNGYAAGLSISAGSTSITNGNSVKITVNASGLIGKFSVTSSNSSVLSGGTSSEWLENESKTYTFSSKSTGKATITVTAIDVADTSGNTYSGSKSVTINVVKPREKSTNNNLKNLSVDGYSISPEFSKDMLEYSVDLEANVEKITISASLEDSYASIDGTGEKEVNLGENKFEITVTSETGSSKVYTIIANVKDNNPITKVVDDQTLTVVKRSNSITKPNDDFVDKTVTISNTEIPAFYNEKLNLTLIGMIDSNSNISLYIYDEEDDKYIKYQQFENGNITIMSKIPVNIPDGYTKTTLKIDDNTYDVYKSDNSNGYYLIYGMNLNTGETNWYSYEETEKTLQIYNDKELAIEKENSKKQLGNYKIAIACFGVFSILLLIIILILVIKRKKVKPLIREQIKNIEIEKNVNKDAKIEEVDTKSISKTKKNKKNNKS